MNLYFYSTGFHLSGVVCTHPPSDVPPVIVPPVLPGQHVVTIRAVPERDAAGNITAHSNAGSYPAEENRKYKVSVSFDR